jgi:hypothetical protein
MPFYGNFRFLSNGSRMNTMGFFDKVKSFKNALTGGGATVYFETEGMELGKPFDITVKATIGDQDLKVSRVYFDIEGCEQVKVRVTERSSEDGDVSSSTRDHTVKTVTHSQHVTVADAQMLSANESYEWKVTVTLPEDLLPIYYGHHCQHTYVGRASLDSFGNDPDSGWVSL